MVENKSPVERAQMRVKLREIQGQLMGLEQACDETDYYVTLAKVVREFDCPTSQPMPTTASTDYVPVVMVDYGTNQEADGGSMGKSKAKGAGKRIMVDPSAPLKQKPKKKDKHNGNMFSMDTLDSILEDTTEGFSQNIQFPENVAEKKAVQKKTMDQLLAETDTDDPSAQAKSRRLADLLQEVYTHALNCVQIRVGTIPGWSHEILSLMRKRRNCHGDGHHRETPELSMPTVRPQHRCRGHGLGSTTGR